VICRVRPATGEDEPRLEEIERACFPSGHWSADDFRSHCCLIAEYEDRIIGFVVVQEVYAGDGGAEAPEIEVLNVAVLPEFRRLGFARALLSQVLARRGVYFLEVRESNEAARRLYREFGFREVTRRVDYYNEPDESAIVMRAERC
jgi:[ribosomal protein S18]-alanine N-acetyltransferase